MDRRNPAPRVHPAIRRPRTGSHGFTLIEILIALVILAVGLLALGALQTTALALGDDARLRTHAAFLADDLVERMRLHPGQANAFVSAAPPGRACTPDGDPTPENLLACWYAAVEQRLPPPPPGVAAAEIERVTLGSDERFRLTLRWGRAAPRPASGSAAAATPADAMDTMQWAFLP